MSQNTTPSGPAFPRIFAWPLELEVELCATGGCEVTAERLLALTALLNDAVGVYLASAEAHGEANFVRVRLTVDAFDLYDALDRVSALVCDCVGCAGLGPAVLVAARAATGPATGWRMGSNRGGSR